MPRKLASLEKLKRFSLLFFRPDLSLAAITSMANSIITKRVITLKMLAALEYLSKKCILFIIIKGVRIHILTKKKYNLVKSAYGVWKTIEKNSVKNMI